MKTFSLKLAVTAAAVFVLGLAAGCASQDSTHAGHAMACCKCKCAMMQPDPANPSRCKMCGHDQKDHNVGTNAPAATPHQH